MVNQPDRAKHLDLRGLKCPFPVLRTRRALRRLGAGQVLVVACTDPLAAIDIPHLVRSEGYRLKAEVTADGVTVFRIAGQAAETLSGDPPRASEPAR